MDVRPGIGSCNRVSESTHAHVGPASTRGRLGKWVARVTVLLAVLIVPAFTSVQGAAAYEGTSRSEPSSLSKSEGCPGDQIELKGFFESNGGSHREGEQVQWHAPPHGGSEHWIEFWNIANTPIEFPATAKGKTSSSAFAYVPLFLILEIPSKGEIKGPHGFLAPFTFKTITECMDREGKEGKEGKQGPTGATGANGATGPTGATGAAGAAGAKGATGEKGATGGAGATGATGTTGAKGETGAAGTNGARANVAPLARQVPRAPRANTVPPARRARTVPPAPRANAVRQARRVKPEPPGRMAPPANVAKSAPPAKKANRASRA